MKYFTPNDDGVNDKWLVEGIENYPKADVEIYDRFHRRLLRVKGRYFRGWDGYYNGHIMPNGDYWFVVLTYGKKESVAGHFMLKR